MPQEHDSAPAARDIACLAAAQLLTQSGEVSLFYFYFFDIFFC
jgi:hypothetical protein